MPDAISWSSIARRRAGHSGCMAPMSCSRQSGWVMNAVVMMRESNREYDPILCPRLAMSNCGRCARDGLLNFASPDYRAPTTINSMQPYPAHLVKHLTLADGTPVTLRPIRAADARIEQEFVRSLSDEARYFRFMDMLRELSPQMLRQMTEIDYHNQMALIAVTPSHNYEVQIAVGRYVVYPERRRLRIRDRGQRWLAKKRHRQRIDEAPDRGGTCARPEENDRRSAREQRQDARFRAPPRFRADDGSADPRQLRATLDLQRGPR